MGTIINTKKRGNKIVSEILSDYDEYLQLKGHLENVRLFSENAAEVRTNISQRGKNAATKYFLIPCQFRKDLNLNNATACHKMEFSDKTIFIYVVDKCKISSSKHDKCIKNIEQKYNSSLNDLTSGKKTSF